MSDTEIEWVRVGAVSDFPEGEARVVSAARKPVAVCALGGRLYALNNICPHLGGPLGAGRIDQGALVCPYHGMRFDVSTGRSADGFGHAVETYPIEVRGEDVVVGVWWSRARSGRAAREDRR